MRLIFKRSIVDRLYDLVSEAEAAGKQIDYIVLTDAEHREYRRWIVDNVYGYPSEYQHRPVDGGTFYQGYRVFKSSQVEPEYRDRQGC